MTAPSRGAFAALGRLRPATPRICRQCARVQIRAPTPSRAYSGAAAAAAASTTMSDSTTVPPSNVGIPPEPKPAGQTAPNYHIKAGVILTRAPLLTRPLTSFEQAYFFYQKRLNERLTLPFITSVYFKPDTPALIDWNMKMKDRQGTVAKELGVYNGKASRAWDDELTVGDNLSKHDTTVDLLLKDSVMRVSDDAEIIPEEDRAPPEALAPRVSEADLKGDTTRLDRAMDRTLYLVVRKDGKDGEKWEFPAAGMSTEENLHEAAQRILDETAGVNMNTWMVGRVPVAAYVKKPTTAREGAAAAKGQKTFFLKGRIMAGQADLTANKHKYKKFKWLTREELKGVLEPAYYRSVRNMMADR
ncbi:NUDIX domain-containing protein [Colletotrichum higginsianum]|uniref:Large ribosomal subunit protein mL46 n=2 Tax=Colletotrichum higginsianum TaxID=80884 RepID=H1VST6_COLHI|nr:NUDIX domain-containing protein [Colletotrichum higginsianum IMI 349063]OBR14325.1 NUDIX domain-containing protein [Colletotrichum higginsianum IMI 349063]TID02481.1 54S ribosomal protein L17, mitochondrial [Colletotrichum higginsianum]CCF43294.1 NUDIX domain-containing protein [Colletotrichum higginsianum]